MNASLEATYRQHLQKLQSIWQPVGDIRKLPSALEGNLRAYISKPENLKDGDLHPIAEAEISVTISLIEYAIKLIRGDNPDIRGKATRFLKRSAHDPEFEQTQLGAYKFRDAVAKSRKSKKDRSDFRKIVCAPCHQSFKWGWELTRLRSQAELADVGTKLNLCVQSLHGYGEAHHDALLQGSMEFWLLSHHSSPHALISVYPEDQCDWEDRRVIDEVQVSDGEDIELNQEVANWVLMSLDVSSYEEFTQVGAFLAFANGSFLYEHPHVTKQDNKHICHFWVDTNHVIVAKRELNADDYEGDWDEDWDDFEDDEEEEEITLDEDFEDGWDEDLDEIDDDAECSPPYITLDEDFDDDDDDDEDSEDEFDDLPQCEIFSVLCEDSENKFKWSVEHLT